MSHYQKFWGTSATITEFNPQDDVSPTPICVAEFAPDSEDQDWVYATVGASRMEIPLSATHNTIPRLELFLYSRQQQPELARFLAGLATYPFVHQTFLSRGDTIRGTKPILSESGLADVLLTYPYFEADGFGIIHCNDKTHTYMVWVIPIYPSERQFIREHGWNALEDLFNENETDTSDFYRQPVA